MKTFISLFWLFLPFWLNAQTNLQLHYDMGKNRNYLTSTFEMFSDDKFGNTFFFVDIDFDGGKYHEPSMAYLEIARCLKFWDAPFSAHIEYNGGMMGVQGDYLPINHAFLGGVDYAWNDTKFTKFLNFKVLYKYITDKTPLSFQLTAVWTLHFFDGKFTASGFADFWRETNTNFTNAAGKEIEPIDTKFVFISEPQFWYNFSKHFAAGSEIEMASNFGSVYGFKVCPTLAVKWIF
ncbi:MAG: DUF5020 family protein [Paludibacter sp.]|jgi:hypothetical protein|nr:DUF5020 family protein [Paludibacter sp.]